MLRPALIATLLTLTFIPACDDRPDDAGDTEAVDSESEGAEDGDSETGAEAGESSGESSGEPPTTGEVPEEEPEGGEESVTPLVLAFAGEAVHFNTAVTASFDLTGTMSVITDWPTSTTPWLAIDRNGNGKIDDGGELFGSATLLASGETAPNGFVALADLDSNHDGRVDATDEQWSRLLVWSDVDGDRKSTVNELKPVAARDLVAVELDYTVDRRCDVRGNCEVERAAFIYRDGRGQELHGAVIDVYLRLR
ncbi:MAG TPA: hypothetical protein VGB85_04355 [Nannocystis sp.]|jgi:hypothetical protein